MDTHFAPAERASNDELQQEVKLVSKNPVIDGLMNAVSGLLAVLNEHRVPFIKTSFKTYGKECGL